MKRHRHTPIRYLLMVLLAISSFTGWAQQSVTLGYQAEESFSYTSPVSSYQPYAHYQMIYTAAELNNNGVPAGAIITSLGFSIYETIQNNGSLANFTISMGHTSQTVSYESFITTGLTVVKPAFTYTPVYTAAYDYDMIQLATPFVWDGVSSIVVNTCTGQNQVRVPAGRARISYYAAGKATHLLQSADACNQVVGSIQNNRPNIKFNYTPPACSGTPVSLMASGPDSVCANAPIYLSISGYPNATGLSFQWQSAPHGSTSYTNLPNGTNPNNTTATQTVATDYRAKLTCSNGGGISYSNVLAVGMNTSECYCASSGYYNNSYIISNVTFGSLSNSSDCITPAPGPNSNLNTYANYKSGPGAPSAPSVLQNSTVPFSVTLGSCSNFPETGGVKVYIDWNKDGQFANPGELVYASPTIITGVHTESGTIVVPANAVNGKTVMRLVTVANGYNFSNLDACSNYFNAETEDYFIRVGPPPPCTGTPDGGIVFTTVDTTYCVNAPPIALKLTNYSNDNTGITIQWQESADNLSYTNIANATSSTFTTPVQSATRFYRATVTCTNSGLVATSSTKTITVLPSFIIACYCKSAPENDFLNIISNVTAGTLNQSSTCSSIAPGEGSIVKRYSNYYSGVGAPAAPQFMHSQSVPLSLQIGDCSYSNNYQTITKVFIDWSQNGSLTDPGELVYTSAYAAYGPHTETGSFTVPGNALTGPTLMRVVNAYASDPNVATPCGSYYAGETEDYKINVVPLPPCTGTPSPATVSFSGISSFCTSAPATVLSASGFSYAPGIMLQWEESANGTTFTSIAGATSGTFTTTASNNTKSYRLKLTCSNSNLSSTSNVATLTVLNATPIATAASDTICSGVAASVALSAATAGTTFTWSAPTVSGGTISGATAGSGTSINQTLTNTGTTPVTVTYTVTGSVSGTVKNAYTYSGVANALPTPAQIAAWQSWRASLLSTYSYTSFNLKGTFDTVGRTLTNNADILQIVNALRMGSNNYVYSNGNEWEVSSYCLAPGAVELSADGYGCGSCGDYRLSPQSGTINWGGVNVNSCTPTTQSIIATATYTKACTATTTVTITVKPNVTVTLTPAAPTRACGSSPTQLSATPATGYQIKYSPITDIYTDASGTTPYTQASNATTVYVSPSSQITYTATAANACGTNTASASVAVTGTPANISGAGTHTDTFTAGGTAIVRDQDCNMIATLQSTGTAPVSGLVSAKVEKLAGAGLTSGDEPFVGRIYNLEPQTNPNSSTATITLYYTQAEFTAYNLSLTPAQLAMGRTLLPLLPVDPNTANVRVTQFHGTGGFVPFTGELITPAVSFSNNRWEVTFPVSRFSSFYLHSSNGTPGNPLSVNLTSLRAVNDGSRNHITWTSGTEKDLARYEVEMATDAKTFTSLATAPATGSGSAYEAYDQSPKTGITYYRLQMTDNDGSITYSQTVSATMQAQAGTFTISTYPNPVSHKLTVEVFGAEATGGVLELTDAAGKLISRTAFDAKAGLGVIDMSGVSAGLYFVKYSDASHTETIKVTKN